MNAIDAGPAGDTKTATPTNVEPPVPIVTVIYDADAEQYVITNADEFDDASWAWQDEMETAISGQTSTTLDRADTLEGLAVRAIANADPATASN